jgi:hypothetical protein
MLKEAYNFFTAGFFKQSQYLEVIRIDWSAVGFSAGAWVTLRTA